MRTQIKGFSRGTVLKPDRILHQNGTKREIRFFLHIEDQKDIGLALFLDVLMSILKISYAQKLLEDGLAQSEEQ
jgi:hypothetical protein